MSRRHPILRRNPPPATRTTWPCASPTPPRPSASCQRSDTAILLENALLDTARPASLPIPDHLRAQGDPGSYIVQARGPIDAAFRSLLKTAGAAIVAYIPNNAYLVRASAAVARQLQADPRSQSVLPYEPYYKLKPSLLELAVGQEPLPDNTVLNLLLFADAREQTLADLKNLGAEVLGEDRSPFGPVVQVQPQVDSLPLSGGAVRRPGAGNGAAPHASQRPEPGADRRLG